MKRIFLLSALLVLLTGPAANAAETHPSYVELADAPSITVDWSKGTSQAVTLGGHRKIAFINGQKGGQYILILKQDATGSRTVTWPTAVQWPGGSRQASILTTTANKKDFLFFFYDGVSYDALAIAQNY